MLKNTLLLITLLTILNSCSSRMSEETNREVIPDSVDIRLLRSLNSSYEGNEKTYQYSWEFDSLSNSFYKLSLNSGYYGEEDTLQRVWFDYKGHRIREEKPQSYQKEGYDKERIDYIWNKSGYQGSVTYAISSTYSPYVIYQKGKHDLETMHRVRVIKPIENEDGNIIAAYFYIDSVWEKSYSYRDGFPIKCVETNDYNDSVITSEYDLSIVDGYIQHTPSPYGVDTSRVTYNAEDFPVELQANDIIIKTNDQGDTTVNRVDYNLFKWGDDGQLNSASVDTLGTYWYKAVYHYDTIRVSTKELGY